MHCGECPGRWPLFGSLPSRLLAPANSEEESAPNFVQAFVGGSVGGPRDCTRGGLGGLHEDLGWLHLRGDLWADGGVCGRDADRPGVQAGRCYRLLALRPGLGRGPRRALRLPLCRVRPWGEAHDARREIRVWLGRRGKIYPTGSPLWRS